MHSQVSMIEVSRLAVMSPSPLWIEPAGLFTDTWGNMGNPSPFDFYSFKKESTTTNCPSCKLRLVPLQLSMSISTSLLLSPWESKFSLTEEDECTKPYVMSFWPRAGRWESFVHTPMQTHPIKCSVLGWRRYDTGSNVSLFIQGRRVACHHDPKVQSLGTLMCSSISALASILLGF